MRVSAPLFDPTAPRVVAKLGSDGHWQVLVTVPLTPPVWDAELELLLNADKAERLARQLTAYAELIRDKIGVPGGKAMP